MRDHGPIYSGIEGASPDRFASFTTVRNGSGGRFNKFLPILLHLLPSFRSSERCPQLGGCRPLPPSESSIERIRILVAEQKCHFRDIHFRPVEVLVRQFLPRLKKQLPESCAVIDYSPLQ